MVTPVRDALSIAGRTQRGRYRLPNIEREGIAQLSLLETAIWPLQGGKVKENKYQTEYTYPTAIGRLTATVTVRAALGLQPYDELVLWGLLGATLARSDPQPALMATPYWMLKHLGPDKGGWQYDALRESLLRLAVTSYQNTAFYNPESKQHEYVAFQFLSILLPTVGGVGESVDNDRCWRIEWNPAFYRFCRGTGSNLLFDLDLYRKLTPAARRLFLKLKDRFHRNKRAIFNVDELTLHGLGYSSSRTLAKRKFDLLNCIRELLDHQVLELGRGQTDPKQLIWKRGKGSYVVSCYQGPYFRQPITARAQSKKNAFYEDDPLYAPLRAIGIDPPAIPRLFDQFSRGLIQRWVRITDAALHEHPRGFTGFRVSAAAFLIDGVKNRRTPPEWMHEHEKRQQQLQWERDHMPTTDDADDLRRRYEEERSAALAAFMASPEGRQKYQEAYPPLLALQQAIDPLIAPRLAHEATLERIERIDFQFADFDQWIRTVRPFRP